MGIIMGLMTTISHVKAKPGKADELQELFVQIDEKVAKLPGLRNRQTLRQKDNSDIFWFVETWESKDAHASAILEQDIRELVVKTIPLFDTVPDTGVSADIVYTHGVN